MSKQTLSTKELARELGCLRKRTSTAKQIRERSTKARQIFAYLVVLDFESTCWQDARYRTQEIIEFPAVLMNTSTGAIESEFQHYVQPMENPILSDFCKQLTGISQDQVDEGLPLSMVLTRFSHWLKRNRETHGFEYNSPAPGAADDGAPRCTFVTWSAMKSPINWKIWFWLLTDWDLGVCLQYEARRKQLRKPPELSAWLDLRATYRKFYERRPKGLNGALQDLGLDFQGREHSGLDDAKNTARLAYRMILDGCVLNITKSIQLSDASSKTKTPLSSEAVSKSRTGCASASPNRSNAIQSITNGGGKPVLCSSKLRPNQSSLKRPASSDVAPSSSKSNKIKPGPSFSVFQDSVGSSDSRRNPSVVGSVLRDLTNNSRFKPASTTNIHFKTPVGSSCSSMKATPPMCVCGRRAKRKLVQTPGPNLGRTFFCCGASKGPSHRGCSFFKWEPSNDTGASPMLTCNKLNTGTRSVPFVRKLPQPNFATPNHDRLSAGVDQPKKTLGLRVPNTSGSRPPTTAKPVG